MRTAACALPLGFKLLLLLLLQLLGLLLSLLFKAELEYSGSSSREPWGFLYLFLLYNSM